MIGPSFEAVLAAAADGDELAFRALWRDLQPGLLRYLNAFAPGSGEDLASETWLRIVKGLPTFTGDERAFRAWVFTVARHRAVDRWRRTTRHRDEPVPLDALAHLPGPDDPATAAVDTIASQAAITLIATLPPDQAEVVLLRVVAGLDVAEVATITGKRPGHVRVLTTGRSDAWRNSSARQTECGVGCEAAEGSVGGGSKLARAMVRVAV